MYQNYLYLSFTSATLNNNKVDFSHFFSWIIYDLTSLPHIPWKQGELWGRHYIPLGNLFFFSPLCILRISLYSNISTISCCCMYSQNSNIFIFMLFIRTNILSTHSFCTLKCMKAFRYFHLLLLFIIIWFLPFEIPNMFVTVSSRLFKYFI